MNTTSPFEETELLIATFNRYLELVSAAGRALDAPEPIYPTLESAKADTDE